MLKKVEGVIVSEFAYKETSKIINIFTHEMGIIGVIARGAMRIKSPFNGLTNKITRGIFHINYRDGLSTLVDVSLIDNYKTIKRDIEKISYASFITELSTQVYKNNNSKDIYDLYVSSLNKINEGFDSLVITNILELKLLSYLGIMPVLDKCVTCGNMSDIITISSYKGGYLCKNCLEQEPVVLTKTIKLIRMFYYVDINKITKIDVSSKVKKEINNFIDDYYERYAGLYLKSKQFLNNLENIS